MVTTGAGTSVVAAVGTSVDIAEQEEQFRRFLKLEVSRGTTNYAMVTGPPIQRVLSYFFVAVQVLIGGAKSLILIITSGVANTGF